MSQNSQEIKERLKNRQIYPFISLDIGILMIAACVYLIYQDVLADLGENSDLLKNFSLAFSLAGIILSLTGVGTGLLGLKSSARTLAVIGLILSGISLLWFTWTQVSWHFLR